jgi:hypothetical protein
MLMGVPPVMGRGSRDANPLAFQDMARIADGTIHAHRVPSVGDHSNAQM